MPLFLMQFPHTAMNQNSSICGCLLFQLYGKCMGNLTVPIFPPGTKPSCWSSIQHGLSKRANKGNGAQPQLRDLRHSTHERLQMDFLNWNVLQMLGWICDLKSLKPCRIRSRLPLSLFVLLAVLLYIGLPLCSWIHLPHGAHPSQQLPYLYLPH